MLKLDREKLIRAREMLGYGLEKTAQVAGVSKNSVLRAEHEEDIRPVTARKIATALEVEVRDLLPLAQAPLPDFEVERRPSVLAEAVVAAADIWRREITDPAASWQTIYQAGEKVLDLQDYISTQLGDPGWWKSLSAQERHDIVHVDKHLDSLVTVAYRRQLERRERDAEQDAQREEFNRRREAIREQTRRISA